jgi:hypothetical protein
MCEGQAEDHRSEVLSSEPVSRWLFGRAERGYRRGWRGGNERGCWHCCSLVLGACADIARGVRGDAARQSVSIMRCLGPGRMSGFAAGTHRRGADRSHDSRLPLGSVSPCSGRGHFAARSPDSLGVSLSTHIDAVATRHPLWRSALTRLGRVSCGVRLALSAASGGAWPEDRAPECAGGWSTPSVSKPVHH